jgi:nuclear transport factor 2 (NTF2) superfamily protein
MKYILSLLPIHYNIILKIYKYIKSFITIRIRFDTWSFFDRPFANVSIKIEAVKADIIDSSWKNRIEFFKGREASITFLKRKWAKELDYRLMKAL